MILADDVGGTKTILAFFNSDGKVIAQETYSSQQHTNLNEIVHKFVSNFPYYPTQACFGVAGPVRNGRCEATNLPCSDLAPENMNVNSMTKYERTHSFEFK